MPLDKERVVVFQTTRYLGDFLLTLPSVRRIAESGSEPILFADMRFALLAELVGCQVIYTEKDAGGNTPAGMAASVSAIKGAKPGAALLTHKSHRNAMMAFLCGIPLRVGFADSQARALYTHRVAYDRGVHEVVRFQGLLVPVGLEPSLVRCEMWFPGRDAALGAGEKLGLATPYAVIAPGASWAVKRWPVARHAEVCSWLAEKGLSVVISGGKADQGIAGELARLAPRAVNLAGRLGLLEFMGLVARASIVISGDSAPVHAAGCFDIPTVAIYGPTVKEMGFWPLSRASAIAEIPMDCRPCKARAERRCPLGHHDCMEKLTHEMVTKAVKGVLGW